MSNNAYVRYATPAQQEPRGVCFTTHTRNDKRYITYGAVTGSKRIRRQLDMPCSLAIYETTLKEIARERHHNQPIEAEFCVLEHHDDAITPEDIYSALQNADENCVRFWEHNIMLFGPFEEGNVTKCTKQEHLKSYLETFQKQIQNKDVIQHRFHKIRPSSEKKDCYEHMFSVVCRFLIAKDNSVLMYGTHVHVGQKDLSISKQKDIWVVAQQNLLKAPQYWFSVPDGVHFNQLCEMDGWS